MELNATVHSPSGALVIVRDGHLLAESLSIDGLSHSRCYQIVADRVSPPLREVEV
jgi:hypothetical protein